MQGAKSEKLSRNHSVKPSIITSWGTTATKLNFGGGFLKDMMAFEDNCQWILYIYTNWSGPAFW
jgi:hypothetical protein